MLIGRDFDKIEISILGFELLEPNAFIGDTIILIIALIIAFKIKKFKQQDLFFKNWIIFFWLFGVGMFLGGIGHLMFNYMGFNGKYLPWLSGILSIYFVEKAMISLLEHKQQSLFNKIIILKLFLFLSIEILVFIFYDMSKDHTVGLIIPVINSTLGFIFTLGYLGYKFSKKLDSNFIYFLYSVILMLPSGIFVAFKINLHPWFDKNDFGHLILVFSMLFFYKPIKSYYLKTLNKKNF